MCKTQRAGWNLVQFSVCCGLATKIPQWANKWLNGMYALGGSQGTWPKPQRAAVFWKQQIGREIQNRFFFHIHFKDPLKHFLLILIHLCYLFIIPINTLCHWGWYQYFHILFFLTLFQAPPPPSCTSWPAVVNQENVQNQQLLWTVVWKPEYSVNNATYFFHLQNIIICFKMKENEQKEKKA